MATEPVSRKGPGNRTPPTGRLAAHHPPDLHFGSAEAIQSASLKSAERVVRPRAARCGWWTRRDWCGRTGGWRTMTATATAWSPGCGWNQGQRRPRRVRPLLGPPRRWAGRQEEAEPTARSTSAALDVTPAHHDGA